ncbi:MAG: invasion associated locus B family protein [Lentilitoribacter sp.]
MTMFVFPKVISNSLAQSTQDRINKITLPGGATSLNETHGDWTVSCGKGQTQITLCAMSQQLFNPENKQRVMAIELTMTKQSILSGTMVLPFGIKLSEGILLSIDEGDVQTKVPFSTCLPVGCLAPLSFNTKMIDAFRAGSIVSIALKTMEGTQLQIELSLDGFSSAHNRIIALKG